MPKTALREWFDVRQEDFTDDLKDGNQKTGNIMQFQVTQPGQQEGDGEDGELVYDGFIVYTEKGADYETVYAVF